MDDQWLTDFREMGRLIDENMAEAERWLPYLLDLDGWALNKELEQHPELRPGIIQLLIKVAHKACERSPERAHELTAVLIEHAERDAPPILAFRVPSLTGNAWAAHASALRGLRRYKRARLAIDTAIGFLQMEGAADWHIANAEVIEAQICHDLGKSAEALVLLGRAAEMLLLHGDRERYVQARIIESSIRWDSGHHHAAGEVWNAAADEALQRGDTVLLAYWESRIGRYQLQMDNAGESVRRFAAAYEAFDAAGLPREAARALWGLAEATAARGRVNEAISEYYKVQALMLANGDVDEASLVSSELLGMLLRAGRQEEAVPLLEAFIDRLNKSEAPPNAMQAWTFVEERARTGRLTPVDIAGVRDHIEERSLRPNAPFLPPEPDA